VEEPDEERLVGLQLAQRRELLTSERAGHRAAPHAVLHVEERAGLRGARAEPCREGERRGHARAQSIHGAWERRDLVVAPVERRVHHPEHARGERRIRRDRVRDLRDAVVLLRENALQAQRYGGIGRHLEIAAHDDLVQRGTQLLGRHAHLLATAE
jgi:hypothetical protein